MKPVDGGPEPVREITISTFTLYGCRCDEPVLDRLIAAVRDGGSNPPVIVEATWHGTVLRSESLAAVRAAIGRSLTPGDPRHLERLRIERVGGERLVVVELADRATVTVAAPDAAWALGRAEQLRRILAHAGGRPRTSHRRPRRLGRRAVVRIDGRTRRPGWPSWSVSDRVAVLGLAVAIVAVVVRVLAG